MRSSKIAELSQRIKLYYQFYSFETLCGPVLISIELTELKHTQFSSPYSKDVVACLETEDHVSSTSITVLCMISELSRVFS